MSKSKHTTEFITSAFSLTPDKNTPRLEVYFSADANDGDYMYRTTEIDINELSNEELQRLAYLLENLESNLSSEDDSEILDELRDYFEINIPYSQDGDFHSLTLESVTFIDENSIIYSTL